MTIWAEHYYKFYSRETTVSGTALENTPPLLAMDELDTTHHRRAQQGHGLLASSKSSSHDNI